MADFAHTLRARFGATRPAAPVTAPTAESATAHDVLGRLVAEGMGVARARFVVGWSGARAVSPFAMWLWLDRFGPERLALAVLGDLTNVEMFAHIAADTAPDFTELGLFAAFNGLEPQDAAA